MTEEVRQAKEKVKWEVEFALNSVEDMADRNNFSREWVLEEFRNQVATEINKRIQ